MVTKAVAGGAGGAGGAVCVCVVVLVVLVLYGSASGPGGADGAVCVLERMFPNARCKRGIRRHGVCVWCKKRKRGAGCEKGSL